MHLNFKQIEIMSSSLPFPLDKEKGFNWLHLVHKFHLHNASICRGFGLIGFGRRIRGFCLSAHHCIEWPRESRLLNSEQDQWHHRFIIIAGDHKGLDVAKTVKP